MTNDKVRQQVITIGLINLYDLMKEQNQNESELTITLKDKEFTIKFEIIEEKEKCTNVKI